MKKAVLLLAMVTLIAGCIYLKNADKDTILYGQQVEQDIQYAEVPEVEYTEEIISKELTVETDAEEMLAGEAGQESVESSEEEVCEQELRDDSNITGVIYNGLTPDEQKIYAEILDSLLAYEEETPLSTTDSKLIDRAFSCVMLDHPEIFYVDGYKYTEYTRDNIVEKIVFTGKYLYEDEEIIRRQNAIKEKAADILANVPDTEDEYLKVKYLYDILIAQTEYDIHAEDNQNICSVFLNGKSVCQGYAKAMQYLLKQLDIECSLVLGSVIGGEGHAWNLVSVNGAWYYLDATWGDAFYLFGEEAIKEQSSVVNYDYLCVTTQQLLLTHSLEMPVELPECVSMKDNYYVREDLYFTNYDRDKLQYIFNRAIENGQETVTVKCSDNMVYDEMYHILLDEQKIFEFMESEGTVAYTDNKEQGILTFWLFEGRY